MKRPLLCIALFLGVGASPALAYDPCPQGSEALEARDWDAAVTAFTLCLDIGLEQDQKQQVYLSRGDAYLQLGQFLEARLDYDVTLVLDPDFSEGYLRLAKLFAVDGKHRIAIDYASQAIFRDPENLDAYRLRALTRIADGRPWPAYDDLNYVLESRPDDWEARLARAEVSRAIGKPKEAMVDVEAVLEAHPDNQTALYQRDVLLTVLERIADQE